MDTWGPDEWAIAWQSAPAHVLEGRGQGGHAVITADDAGSDDAGPKAAASSGRGVGQVTAPGQPTERRPHDNRPPVGPLPPRRRRLPRSADRAQGSPSKAGNADGEDGVDLQQLETRIRGMAADLAASVCEWLHLVEEFDRKRGWADAGLQSCAAWLSWTCSVAPGTAREYVRVARMLPLLPLVDEAFAAGRLSYSKVRILIKVADEVDEAVLLQQAQVQTVSQFERTVRAHRRGDGWSQQHQRRAVWRWDDDGMLVLSARLPADEGALLVAALERARDDVAPVSNGADGDTSRNAPVETGQSNGGETPGGDGTSGGDVVAGDGAPDSGERHPMPQPTDADRQRAALTGADPLGTIGADLLAALVERALAAGDVDSSGDDRHLLVLHAALDQPVGDEEPAGPDAEGDSGSDGSAVPSPTAGIADAAAADITAAADTTVGQHSWRRTAARTTLAGSRCHVENGPGLDRRTAQRIACDAAIVAVLHHVAEGEPLRLGRKTRAISPALRRALRIRDGGCRFPGCHRRGHLEAHHVRPWSLLGPTDLDNLVLVADDCAERRFHHMLIHEGEFRVSPATDGRWEFHDPHGAPVSSAPPLPGSAGGGAPPAGALDPLGLFPGWAGEPFHLAETVAVLARNPRQVDEPSSSVQEGAPR